LWENLENTIIRFTYVKTATIDKAMIDCSEIFTDTTTANDLLAKNCVVMFIQGAVTRKTT